MLAYSILFKEMYFFILKPLSISVTAKLIYKNPQNNGVKNYVHIIFRHFYSNDENALVCLSKNVIAAFTSRIWSISSIKHFIKIKMSNL